MHSDLAVGKRFPDLTLPDHRQQLIGGGSRGRAESAGCR